MKEEKTSSQSGTQNSATSKLSIFNSKSFLSDSSSADSSFDTNNVPMIKITEEKMKEDQQKILNGCGQCDFMLSPSWPKDFNMYKLKLIIINFDPEQLFYINSEGNRQKIIIKDFINFKRKLEKIIPKKIESKIESGRKRESLSIVGKEDYPRIKKELDKLSLTLGYAYGDGDCFYDAIAQGLEAIGIPILGESKQLGHKNLRMICKNYVKEKGNQNWLQSAIDDDYELAGPVKIGVCEFRYYQMLVGFTQAEVEKKLREGEWRHKYAIWGRPSIEGRIICETLKVRLHVIELMEDLVISHQLIDEKVSKSLGAEPMPEDIIFDEKCISIFIHNAHYVTVKKPRCIQMTKKQLTDLGILNNDTPSLGQENKGILESQEIEESGTEQKKIKQSGLDIKYTLPPNPKFTTTDSNAIADKMKNNKDVDNSSSSLSFTSNMSSSFSSGPNLSSNTSSSAASRSGIDAKKASSERLIGVIVESKKPQLPSDSGLRQPSQPLHKTSDKANEVKSDISEDQLKERLSLLKKYREKLKSKKETLVEDESKKLEERLNKIQEVILNIEIKLEEKKMDSPQSHSMDLMTSIKITQTPKPTCSDGSCALHSVLGEWNGKEYKCNEIKDKQKKLAQAVREKNQSKEELKKLIQTSIKELVMSEQKITGESWMKLRKKYREFLKDEHESFKEIWNNFSVNLQENKDITGFIDTNYKREVNRSDYPFRYKFYSALSQKDGELYGLILSLPKLQKKFEEYNYFSNTCFDWDAYINTDELRKDYADFISTPRRWLLPSELGIIAHVFEKTILYYSHPSCATPLKFNPGYTEVSVQFNGSNHYERLEVVCLKENKEKIVTQTREDRSHNADSSAVEDKMKKNKNQDNEKIKKQIAENANLALAIHISDTEYTPTVDLKKMTDLSFTSGVSSLNFSSNSGPSLLSNTSLSAASNSSIDTGNEEITSKNGHMLKDNQELKESSLVSNTPSMFHKFAVGLGKKLLSDLSFNQNNPGNKIETAVPDFQKGYDLVLMSSIDGQKVKVERIEKFLEEHNNFKGKPIVIRGAKDKEFAIFGMSEKGQWQLTYGLNFDVSQSLRGDTHPTKCDGYCAFHAVLGECGGEIESKKSRVRGAILSTDREGLCELVVTGIKKWIDFDCNHDVEARGLIKKFCEEHQDFKSNNFNWKSNITKEIKKKYADFICTAYAGLYSSELEIIANVFDVSVVYYYSTSNDSRLTLNPGKKSKVAIQYNGGNHFEKLILGNNALTALILPGRQVREEIYQEIISKQGHILPKNKSLLLELKGKDMPTNSQDSTDIQPIFVITPKKNDDEKLRTELKDDLKPVKITILDIEKKQAVTKTDLPIKNKLQVTKMLLESENKLGLKSKSVPVIGQTAVVEPVLIVSKQHKDLAVKAKDSKELSNPRPLTGSEASVSQMIDFYAENKDEEDEDGDEDGDQIGKGLPSGYPAPHKILMYKTLSLSNNEYYDGTVNEKYQRQGSGTSTTDNSYYLGQYDEDMKSGRGFSVEYQSHNTIYERQGLFVKDQFVDGYGSDGKMHDGISYTYQGPFENGKFEGLGRLIVGCHPGQKWLVDGVWHRGKLENVYKNEIEDKYTQLTHKLAIKLDEKAYANQSLDLQFKNLSNLWEIFSRDSESMTILLEKISGFTQLSEIERIDKIHRYISVNYMGKEVFNFYRESIKQSFLGGLERYRNRICYELRKVNEIDLIDLLKLKWIDKKIDFHNLSISDRPCLLSLKPNIINLFIELTQILLTTLKFLGETRKLEAYKNEKTRIYQMWEGLSLLKLSLDDEVLETHGQFYQASYNIFLEMKYGFSQENSIQSILTNKIETLISSFSENLNKELSEVVNIFFEKIINDLNTKLELPGADENINSIIASVRNFSHRENVIYRQIFLGIVDIYTYLTTPFENEIFKKKQLKVVADFCKKNGLLILKMCSLFSEYNKWIKEFENNLKGADESKKSELKPEMLLELSNDIFYKIIDQDQKDTNHVDHAVTALGSLNNFLENLSKVNYSKMNNDQANCVLKVIKKLLELIKKTEKTEHLGPLIKEITASLNYLSDVTKYQDLNRFLEDSIEPFELLIESDDEFEKNLDIISKHFLFNRKLNEIGFKKAIELFQQKNVGIDINYNHLKLAIEGGQIETKQLIFFSGEEKLLGYDKEFERKLTAVLASEEKGSKKGMSPISELVTKTREAAKSWGKNSKLEAEVNDRLKIIPSVIAGLSVILSLGASKFFQDDSKTGQFILREDAQKREKILLKPHVIQILGVMMMLGIGSDQKNIRNSLAEIKTGQGKSWTLALLAGFFSLIGYSVEIVCYNDYLIDRDQKNFDKILAPFRFSNVKFLTFRAACQKKLQYTENITFREMMCKLIQGERIPNSCNINEAEKSVLLIDEADVCSEQISFNQGFLSSIKSPFLRLLQQTISLSLGKLNKTEKKLDEQELKELNFEAKRLIANRIQETDLKEEPILAKLKGTEQFNTLIECHIYKMVRDAVKIFYQTTQSEFRMSNGQVEVKVDGKYVSYVHCGYQNAFYYLKSIYDSEGAFTKIKLNENNYGCLSLSGGWISYVKVIKEYPYIFGVTGTLESLTENESKFFADEYNLERRCYYPSFFGLKSKLVEEKMEILDDEKSWGKSIVDDATSKISQGRAVLIFFQNEKELMDFRKKFTQALGLNPYVITLNVIVEPSGGELPYSHQNVSNLVGDDHAGNSGQVTLLTREFGRGVDFQAKAKVNSIDGVHVIQAFFSDDIKEEIQIKGRTARQDFPGSYKMILCSLFLKENMRSLKTYKDLDAFRTKIQDDLFEINRKYLHETVEKQHYATMRFFKELPSARDKSKYIEAILRDTVHKEEEGYEKNSY